MQLDTEGLQDIALPCWIYDQQLDTVLGSNDAAQDWRDIPAMIRGLRDELLTGLRNQDLVLFGEPKQFIAYRVKEQVFVQCLADQAIQISRPTSLHEKQRELKNTQEELRQQGAKLRAIFDSTALFIWTLDGQGRVTAGNSTFKEQMKSWFGKEVSKGEVLMRDLQEENVEELIHFQRAVEQCMEGKKKHIQLKLRTIYGEYIWLEVSMDPIQAADGEIHEISCVGKEITEQKQRVEQIDRQLREKENLLKEVHHRVKNNLQIISSLLNLQQAVSSDEIVLDILRQSQNRVRSMSYVHESLYINNDISAVDMRDYVKGLCSNLMQSYEVTNGRVVLAIDVDKVGLELDQAIPCGLILNELISNALHHAFPEGEQGRIHIQISEQEGRMAILVEDNGKGIPQEWNVEESESLGIQLVYTLTEQLDGEIEFSREKGTKYLITFDRIKTSRTWQEQTS